MKRQVYLVVLALVLVVVASVPALGLTTPNMTGSKHDFRSSAFKDATGLGTSQEICKACHIPHNAKQDAYLWANEYGYSGTTTGSAASDLCMSCHDGTLAAQNLPSASFNTSAKLTLGSGSHTHPVGVTYPSSDTGFEPDAGNLPLEGVDKLVTCGSCHDPHGTGKMLRTGDNINSKLCVACHKK